MNKFSCSLSCAWMTIISCLFYASFKRSLDALLSMLLNW